MSLHNSNTIMLCHCYLWTSLRVLLWGGYYLICSRMYYLLGWLNNIIDYPWQVQEYIQGTRMSLNTKGKAIKIQTEWFEAYFSFCCLILDDRIKFQMFPLTENIISWLSAFAVL